MLKKCTRKSSDTETLRIQILNGDFFVVIWRGDLPRLDEDGDEISPVPNRICESLAVYHIAFLLQSPYRPTFQRMTAKALAIEDDDVAIYLEASWGDVCNGCKPSLGLFQEA